MLARAPRSRLPRGSIRGASSADPGLLEGLDAEDAEAALEEVEAVERVSRVTDRADEVAVLVGTRHAIGDGHCRDAAPAVHRALRRSARRSRPGGARARAGAADGGGTKLAALRLLQSLQHMPFVLGGRRPTIKGMPDARTLFQAAGGFCDCEHCGSVYSPAAYFVDLLRYLNVSSTRTARAAPEASRRRQRRAVASSCDASSRSTCCSAAVRISPIFRSRARTR